VVPRLLLGEETARGLSDREDRLFAALFRARLEIGSRVVFVATTEANAFLDGETARRSARITK